MKGTNRIEPGDPAVMIITTQMEVIRSVELLPTKEILTRLSATIKQSQRTLCFIACVFTTVGILALSIVISGLIIAFGKTNIIKDIGIERYDLGDLYYGINNVNQMNLPFNTYLTNDSKIFIQKYLSGQLINQPGYHGLVIDRVSINNHLSTNRRKHRAYSSCSIMFIIENIQVYFDECSACINERNLNINRLFSNITFLQQLLHLILNDMKFAIKICSIPNISQLIPIRLNTSYAQKSNSKYIYPTIPFENNQIKSTSVNHLTTEFDLFQTQETSTDTQTSSYIEQTTQSPVYIPISTKLSTTIRQRSSVGSSVLTKTTSIMFQFLPFRPLTTISSARSTLSNPMIKTITNQSKSPRQ